MPKEKIREVIGTGGKVIREIVEQTGTKIDIEDDGTIKIAATEQDQAQAAIDWIRGIVAEPEIGVIYNGKVVKTADFGAFVNFLGPATGWCISASCSRAGSTRPRTSSMSAIRSG